MQFWVTDNNFYLEFDPMDRNIFQADACGRMATHRRLSIYETDFDENWRGWLRGSRKLLRSAFAAGRTPDPFLVTL